MISSRSEMPRLQHAPDRCPRHRAATEGNAVHELERYMRCKDCSEVRGYRTSGAIWSRCGRRRSRQRSALDMVAGRAVNWTNVQSLQHHYKPSRDHRAVPRRQPLCRQPRADAGRVSGLSGPGDPQLRRRTRNDDDALGNAAATASRWIPGHEHQEHFVTTLAGVA